jgi:hypothetical protein
MIQRALKLYVARATAARILPPIRHSSQWSPGPAPPRLPKEEQEIFEELQRRSTGAFSTPQASSTASPPSELLRRINQSPQSTPQTDAGTTASSSSSSQTSVDSSASGVQIEASGEGEELHPHIRRGAKPEFEGDVNPKTGEVDGPKNEPLRWGAQGDYSFNGRVTDF